MQHAPSVSRRVRIAKRLHGRLIARSVPGVSRAEDRELARRIRRVLTMPDAGPLDLRLSDGRAADFGRRMAALAGCPDIWWGTVWQ